MDEGLLYAVILFGGSTLVGVLFAWTVRHRIALVLSGLLPWCIFLALNLYSEFRGSERELLQGTWMFFQVTLGTLAAASGLLGYSLAKKAKR